MRKYRTINNADRHRLHNHPRRHRTAATAASTTSTAVAAPTSAATTILPWLGFVDRQPPPVMLVVVESLDRRLSLGVRVHLHEAEPLRAVRIPVYDDLCALHGAVLGEHRLQVGLVDVVGEVAHIQFLAHDRTPKRKADDPRDAFRVEKKGASVEAHWVDKTREGSSDRIGKNQRCHSVVRPTDQRITRNGRD